MILSYFIRQRLHESPIFEQLKKEGKTSKTPIKDAFTTPGNVKLMLKGNFWRKCGAKYNYANNIIRNTFLSCKERLIYLTKQF